MKLKWQLIKSIVWSVQKGSWKSKMLESKISLLSVAFVFEFRDQISHMKTKVFLIKNSIKHFLLFSRWPTVSTLVLSSCSLMMCSNASGSDRSLRHRESCSSVWRRRGHFWAEWLEPQGLSVVVHIPPDTSVIKWKASGEFFFSEFGEGDIWSWVPKWSCSTTTCSQVWGVSPEEVVFWETIRSGRMWITHPSPQDHHRRVQ